jgi:hypothetical protein
MYKSRWKDKFVIVFVIFLFVCCLSEHRTRSPALNALMYVCVQDCIFVWMRCFVGLDADPEHSINTKCLWAVGSSMFVGCKSGTATPKNVEKTKE